MNKRATLLCLGILHRRHGVAGCPVARAAGNLTSARFANVRMDIVSAGILGLDAVLAQRAFTLIEGQARFMLCDQRLMSHRVRDRVGQAAASGNSAARTFVESVAREHKGPTTREMAEATLLAWRPK